MQKLTHTSHLWRMGGRQPIPDVWLVPALKSPRPTNYCFLIERLGNKNRVQISLLEYDYQNQSIQCLLRKSEVHAKDMSWELVKMNQEYLARRPRLRYTSWGVTGSRGSTYLRNLSDALVVYINSIDGIDIPRSGVIYPA